MMRKKKKPKQQNPLDLDVCHVFCTVCFMVYKKVIYHLCLFYI